MINKLDIVYKEGNEESQQPKEDECIIEEDIDSYFFQNSLKDQNNKQEEDIEQIIDKKERDCNMEEEDEMGINFIYETSTPEDSKFVESFLSQLEEKMELVKSIEEMCEELKTGYTKIWGALGMRSDEKRMENELEGKKKNIVCGLNELKDFLKKINEENRMLLESFGGDIQTAEYRIRNNQYKFLLNKFSLVLKRYQEIENNFHIERKNELKRKLKIVGMECDDENIQKQIDNSNVLSNPKVVFSQIQGISSLQTEYHVILENRKELLKLENGMNELYDMFLDMYALVNGEHKLMIDNIEKNVEQASKYVDYKTLKNFKKEKEKKKKEGKKKRVFNFLVRSIVKKFFIK